MFKLTARLRWSEKGATAIEYGLLAALVALGLLLGAGNVGGTVSSSYEDMGSCLSDPGTDNADC